MGRYATPGPVMTIETDFVEKGEQILRASRQTTRILARQMMMAEPKIAEYGKMVLQENTPKGPDSWHHVGGLSGGGLWGATDVHLGIGDQTYTEMAGVSGIGGVIEQYEIDFAQPAENPYGVQYAPFVILGHNTRNQVSYVGGRPYPTTALEQMVAYVNEVLDGVARQVATESVQYMSYGTGAAGA